MVLNFGPTFRRGYENLVDNLIENFRWGHRSILPPLVLFNIFSSVCYWYLIPENCSVIWTWEPLHWEPSYFITAQLNPYSNKG